MSDTRKGNDARSSRSRSRITNGKFGAMDGRSTWARRARDLADEYAHDLGGWDVLTNAQTSLCRRAAILTTELERAEATFADAGEADPDMLRAYQTSLNSLRRTLESLGLSKSPKAVRRSPLVEALAFIDGVRVGPVDATTQLASQEARTFARILSFSIEQAKRDGTPLPPELAAIAQQMGLAAIIHGAPDDR